MPLLKHPTAGTIIDVTGARAKTLIERGYQEVDADEADLARQAAAPSGTRAVQPQPPIDTRGDDAPAPPVESRPADMVTDPPIDTRPENPLGATAASVEEADGAGLTRGADEMPAKSAGKAEWVAYGEAHGVEDADSLTKPEIIDRLS